MIGDGGYGDRRVVRGVLGAKGPERAVLITDAISATGMPDGSYRLGALEVEVKGDRCEYQGRLAGSVLTLDRAVRNGMSFAGWKLQQAVQLATCNPAQRLGISSERGLVAPGRIRDIVALHPERHVVHPMAAAHGF